jgi:ornithine cyclodeaminase/alanine dehydrogenase-like protein (mu-crystallin family)
MRVVSAVEIDRVLTYPALVEALEQAFRGGIAAPSRHHHTIRQEGADATLLLMPAWTEVPRGKRGGGKGHASTDPDDQQTAPGRAGFLGCKLVTVFPDNASRGKPSVHGTYLLASGDTGEPLAVMDAQALTAWRTAAASALAARHLAAQQASHLVMVGAGALASHLVRAHAAVRPIRRVSLWNRTRSRAVSLAFGLAAVSGLETEIVDDLEAAVRDADIVSCATLAAEPLIRGAWLKKGVHLDLVGAFTPQMREADDQAVKRARLYVDTNAAVKDAGDIAQPLKSGAIASDHVRGDLAGLCRGTVKGRTGDLQVTMFKSVGTALEDLAAAALVWRLL